jgi:DNA gyrase subunit A
MIRLGVDSVRIAGRKTLGVTLFRLAAEERVVSVAPLAEAATTPADGQAGG